ncbi:tape measure protein [Gilliamella sp. Pas-s25]|uniref:tape measure protein n=1 Tax=Gilliamella sp. Pas-s25 TaxID=2687310 RepID=UPI00135DBE25|nr:tape measure protein [Gilliamella sp. Pas-s25]MWP63113.1 tape measure protein [Gilliamella sp. Pas-s25]
MSSESIVITVSDNIASSISTKLDNIASSAERAQKHLELMKKILKSFNDDPLKKYLKSMFSFSDMLKAAASGATTFNNSLNDTNSTIKKAIGLNAEYTNQLKNMRTSIVDVNNASINATSNQRRFAEELKHTSSVANTFSRVLKTLFGFMRVRAFVTSIASLTDFKARLDDTTGSAEAGYAAMKRLMTLAKGTYSSFDQTAESFLSNATALKELGYSTNQQLMYTESLNNALVASSIKGEHAASEMYALQKAMMLGKLSGLELMTVVKNGGYVVDVLAKQLGITAGKLQEAGQQGRITSDVIMQAFLNYHDFLQQKANDMPKQILDALTNIKTGIQEFIFGADSATGASSKLTQALLWLSENIKNAAAALTVLGTGYIAAALYHALFIKSVNVGNKTVTKAAAAVMRLNLALLANPIGAIIVAITAVIAALTLFSDEIKLTEDGTVSLKDLAITVWGDIKDGITSAIKGMKGAWDSFVNIVNDKLSDIPFTVNDIFQSIIDTVKLCINTVIRMAMTQFAILSFAFNNMGSAWEIVWNGMKNLAIDIIESVLNSWQLLFKGCATVLSYFNEEAAKSLLEKVDSMTIKFDRAELSSQAKDDLEKLEKELKQISETNYVGLAGGLLNEKIEKTRRRKIAEETALYPLQGDTNTSAAIKHVKELASEHDKLLNSLKPMRGALQEYNKGLIELDTMYKQGSLSASEYSEYITLLENKYKESIDPLGYYNKELNRQWDLMKLSSEQRTIENELYRVSQDMMSKGLVLSKAQNDELRTKIALNEKYVRILAIKDSLESNSQFRKNQDFSDLVSALSELKDSKNFAYNDLINALNTDSKSPFAGMFEGTWELMSAQISQFQRMYEQINVLTEQFNLDQSTAASLRAQVWAKQNDIILSQANNFFEQMAQMQNSNNATMARIGKAAAIAQAVINTYQAANAAYAAMAGIPYVGPALGATAAAAAIAAGMANVAAIRSQPTGFMTGGYTGDIARDQIAGVVHGQEFVMNAAATQRIGVSNLEALQRGDMSGLQRPQVVNNYSHSTTQDSAPQTVSPIINIALVSDHESAEEWLSTQEGVKQIMQINRDNGEELATIVNAS